MGGDKKTQYWEGGTDGTAELDHPQPQRAGKGEKAEEPWNEGAQVYENARQKKAQQYAKRRQHGHQPIQCFVNP